LAFIHKSIAPEPKKLNETRGKVIADYQDSLEKIWIQELRKKFKIEIKKDTWEKIKEKYN